MTRYYLADLHLGHDLVAEHRGFDSTADHDNAVMESLLTLGKGDQLWVLGDICGGSTAGANYALDRLADIDDDVEMFLVAGNHDKCWAGHRDAHRHVDTFLDVFDGVTAFARHRVNVAGKANHVMLSHFPYVGDHTDDDRYVEYRLRDTGRWLLHGHTHAGLSYQPLIHPRQLCVSWDAWGSAVPDYTIGTLIGELEARALEAEARRSVPV
ncbi:metallophosphoesterase [Gordonia phage Mulch]|uniref:Metallophosphoesterase n=5 Tax=Betterkatzvirus betterkatz TaxID=2560485 RepID=A0A2Z5HDG1_9CAUD|nr:metallophosphoesterase [Gordonia phage Nadeem]AZS11230.1 metallophosphatase [Gordonia phage WheatThin]QAU06860.1 metallophosphoesterase [Gordonia phage Brylie]QAX92558.1 metallophosphoesterase [Gordonia phage Mulch]QAY06519.1 metallophosphoesterase [Gordonia phage Parada]